MLHVYFDIHCFTDSPTMKVRTSYMVTFSTAVLICSVVLLTVVYSTWRLEIRLFWKDHFGKLENGNSGRYVCM